MIDAAHAPHPDARLRGISASYHVTLVCAARDQPVIVFSLGFENFLHRVFNPFFFLSPIFFRSSVNIRSTGEICEIVESDA